MSSQLTWFEIKSVCCLGRAPLSRGRAPMIQAEAARKRRGQRDRPSSNFVSKWIGPTTTNSSRSDAPRTLARMGEPLGLATAVEGDAVQLHPVIDETEAELLGDAFLQRLELLIDKLDDVAGFHVDQMIVMRVRGSLVA